MRPPFNTSDYTFEWSSTAQTGPLVAGLPAGTYSVLISSLITGALCDRITVQLASPPQLAGQVSSVFNSSSISFQHTASITGGVPPYTYQWSNGSSGTSTIVQGTVSAYALTVTDVNGCQLYLNAGPIGQITGVVFGDRNQNCTYGTGDDLLAGWIVQAYSATDTFYAVTQSGGSFVMSVLPGTYVLRTAVQHPVWALCTPSYTVTVPNNGTASQFIGVIPLVSCPGMTVDIATPFLRRCFNNFYSVSYANVGTQQAGVAYVDVTLPPFVTFVSAGQTPYLALPNGRYRFYIGPVATGESGQFQIMVHVSCQAPLGMTHCAEARVFPDTLCTAPNPLWTGGDLRVRAECDGNEVYFILKNAGTGPLPSGLDYIIVEDFVMLMQGNVPNLAPGDSVAIALPADGSAYYLRTEQVQHSPWLSIPTAYIEGCGPAANLSLGLGTQFSMGARDPFLDIDCTVNQGAYDPNDKRGTPVGYGPKHYILPETPIDYLIRFQNTGTDTAFTVVILDTLSHLLDLMTVEPTTASHAYTWELVDEGVLRFTFANILLPDSNINEPLSHGFVVYRVRPRADAPLESRILNSAAIYFDFNDPVITNLTEHTLGISFMTVSLWQPVRPEVGLRVTPNPFTDRAEILLEGMEAPQGLQAEIRRLDGGLCRSFSIGTDRFMVEKGDLPPGVYFLVIRAENGAIGRARVVVGGQR